MRRKAIEAVFLLLAATMGAAGQVTFGGSIQSDVLLPQSDGTIGTETYKEDALTNSYVDLSLLSKYIDAGARVEYLDHPLPGFENDFAGKGLSHIYVRGKIKKAEITLGDYYEQFGSGFILRTYEERSLGIDNALRGARIKIRPTAGVTVKALTGRQRRYWEHNKALISGGDIEVNIDQWIKGLSGGGASTLTLGASFVNKHEPADDNIFYDATHRLKLPDDVNAWDLRGDWRRGAVGLLLEYAGKTQDPSFDNGYSYGSGSVAMISGSWSSKGASILLQAKRSDNMSFRSKRSMTGISSMINHLPAFTHDQTYALAALYPYATHPDGEWAYQAEMGYRFRKGTVIGGAYGAKIKVNYSHVRAIDEGEIKNPLDAADPVIMGSDGRKSRFFGQGDDIYYQDFDIQIEKRLSRPFRLIMMYMYQQYNQTIVEGHGGNIYSNIFILDGRYRFSAKTTLRLEGQLLLTEQDQGGWLYGLSELSLVPHWMISLADMYNSGDTHIHYYQGLLTYTTGAHRVQIGYGRTRAGYNCSGGVCRWVPAQKGFTASYNYNF